LHTEIDRARLREVARVRVLVADTDTTGIVYHASYLRYLELARVELIRAAGLPYRVLEAAGLALPLTDIAVRYRAPAKHDDFMTIEAGLVLLTRVRVAFQYVVAIAPGDRHGLDARLELLTAETRHACVRLADGRPERLPAPVYELLESCYRNAGGVRGAGP
jgi:acyl-CoA thioester hydrolase